MTGGGVGMGGPARRTSSINELLGAPQSGLLRRLRSGSRQSSPPAGGATRIVEVRRHHHFLADGERAARSGIQVDCDSRSRGLRRTGQEAEVRSVGQPARLPGETKPEIHACGCAEPLSSSDLLPKHNRCSGGVIAARTATSTRLGQPAKCAGRSVDWPSTSSGAQANTQPDAPSTDTRTSTRRQPGSAGRSVM